MEKTKLHTTTPVEKYGGLDPGYLSGIEWEALISLDELLELMKTPKHQVTEKIQLEYGSVDGLCRRLGTSIDAGLRSDDFEDLKVRKEKYGSNSIPSRKSKSFVYFLWEAIQDITLVILLIAAVISLGLSFYSPPETSGYNDPTDSNAGFIEGIGILVAVAIVVLVTAGINWHKDAQFRGLQRQLAEQWQCSVIRSQAVIQLPTTELVVGDIVLVEYGDAIPADGVVIYSCDLKLDESSHSGESKEARKSVTTDPVLFSGTHVLEGSGKMVVTCVGLNSAKGIIFSLLGAAEGEETEPKKKKVPTATLR